MVMGEGKNPNVSHLLKLANEAKIKKDRAAEIVEATKSSLSKWPTLAKQYGVNDTNIKLIQKKINEKKEGES
jgi:serine/threonine-protein kinase HipA